MAGTILVTGATGNIGRELLPSLIAKGAKVRALVRETSNVQGLWDAGVELVFGDLDRVETLEAAFSGVDKVFLLTPPNANQVSQARNGIAAAKRAGVRQLVRLSAKSLELRADSPGRVTRQHFAIEGELKASGLVYTIIRPHFFMQNTLLSAETVASEGVLYAPMEDGRVGMIDVRDIVEVATKVLTEEGHAGKTYDLSGPASVSYYDVAAGLSQALGREVRYVDVPARGRTAGDRRRGRVGVDRRCFDRIFRCLWRRRGRFHVAGLRSGDGARPAVVRGVRARLRGGVRSSRAVRLGSRLDSYESRGTAAARVAQAAGRRRPLGWEGTMVKDSLADMAVEAASRESVPLAKDELEELLREVAGWSVVSIDGVERLQRRFEFPDFAQALAFTSRAGCAGRARVAPPGDSDVARRAGERGGLGPRHGHVGDDDHRGAAPQRFRDGGEDGPAVRAGGRRVAVRAVVAPGVLGAIDAVLAVFDAAEVFADRGRRDGA